MNVLLKTTISPAIPALQNELPTFEGDGEGEEMDRTMSIGAAFALVIFPPAGGMTLLVSELVFATRAKREAVERIVSVVLVHDALAWVFRRRMSPPECRSSG